MVRCGPSVPARRTALDLVLILLIATLAASDAAAQAPAVRDAERFRTEGDLDAAVSVLRDHLTRQPNDGDAARLLAQTLYWQHDVAGAERAYEEALRRHPEDSTLRLQYGRMLVETRAWNRARVLLTPLVQQPATHLDATMLLGTMAYWQGNLTEAKALFADVVAQTPDHAEARRLLQEIATLSASWVRVAAGLRHDDQPLDRFGGGFEAGWFTTPLVPVTIRVEPLAFRLTDERVRRLWSTEAGVSTFFPHSRLELEAAGGVLRRDGDVDAMTWTGRAGGGIRAGSKVILRGRVERRPYLNTTASLDVPVMVQSARGLINWTDPRGWLAEAGVDVQRFPDENVVRNAYGWLLAPLVHASRGELQAGYAWGWANARESRFVLASPVQAIPPADPTFDLSGRYVPYFTPDDQMAHSVTAAASIGASDGTNLRVSGSYAIRATEQAPFFTVINGVVTRLSYERTYSPWTGRATLTAPVGSRVRIGIGGEVGRTAFYEWASADLYVLYRFTPRPIERSPQP